MNLRAAIVLVLIWLVAAPAARATDRETVEQRVDDAVALYEAEGFAKLCAVASDPDGPFQADEAYVFVFQRDGSLLCHPRPDLIDLPAGQVSQVERILRNAEARPGGAWTRYPWPHPATLELGAKSTYCRISGGLVICAGGYFDVGSV